MASVTPNTAPLKKNSHPIIYLSMVKPQELENIMNAILSQFACCTAVTMLSKSTNIVSLRHCSVPFAKTQLSVKFGGNPTGSKALGTRTTTLECLSMP